MRHRLELDDFEAWADLLRQKYREAESGMKTKRANRPRKQPINALKIAAYKYLVEIEGAGLVEELGCYLDSRDGKGWRRVSSDSATAVFRLAIDGEQSGKNRMNRSRAAAELRLAWTNKVDPGLLLGFLFEAGPTTLIKKGLAQSKVYRWAKPYRLRAYP